MKPSENTIGGLLASAVALRPVSDSPRLDVELLLAHVLGKTRTHLYTWPEQKLSAGQLIAFNRLLKRRLDGEPVAYLTGVRDFWSLSLEVNASTLIPRPETEVLVEMALGLVNSSSARVLDLGAGTGAIALALAMERPGWQVLAVDVMPEAVALVERNRRKHGLNNVRVIQSNWFADLPDRCFDLIVSNPPYLEPDDPHLSEGDVRFEPRSALVAANSGLAALEVIVSGAPAYLETGGWLVLEHGFKQAARVQAMMAEAGFIDRACARDLQGHERVSYGRQRLQLR